MTAQIIQFKPRTSAAYNELEELFDICGSIEACNFYLELVEEMGHTKAITERELHTLRRIGRQKRLELAKPASTRQVVTAPGTYLYTPEMGQEKPACQIEAEMAYYGGHYFLWTDLELKGRGITLNGENTTRRTGKYEYYVTKRAFGILEKKYTISFESHLD